MEKEKEEKKDKKRGWFGEFAMNYPILTTFGVCSVFHGLCNVVVALFAKDS